jgi:hypothetical protein
MQTQHTRHDRNRHRLLIGFTIGGAILAIILTAGMLYYWHQISHLR